MYKMFTYNINQIENKDIKFLYISGWKYLKKIKQCQKKYQRIIQVQV